MFFANTVFEILHYSPICKMDSLFCYHIVLLFVATIAFCLLWIGFATPGWFVVTVQEAEAANEYTVSAVNR